MPPIKTTIRPTIQEIRQLQNPVSDKHEEGERKIAARFNLDDADNSELAFLAICRAVYGRYKETNGSGAPVEHFLCGLLQRIGYWPQDLEDVLLKVEELRIDLQERADVAASLQGEVEELRWLSAQRGMPSEGCSDDEA